MSPGFYSVFLFFALLPIHCFPHCFFIPDSISQCLDSCASQQNKHPERVPFPGKRKDPCFIGCQVSENNLVAEESQETEEPLQNWKEDRGQSYPCGGNACTTKYKKILSVCHPDSEPTLIPTEAGAVTKRSADKHSAVSDSPNAADFLVLSLCASAADFPVLSL